MDNQTESSNIVRFIFILFFTAVLLFLFASNLGRVNKSAVVYKKEIKSKKQHWSKTVFGFPQQFEKNFGKEFLQRSQFMRWYETNYLSIFGESSSANFYMEKPQKEKLAFLSKHPRADVTLPEIRYDLFFTQLQGGYSSREVNIETAKNNILKRRDFLDSIKVPTLILSFPTKPLLNFNVLPEYIQASVGNEAYEKPVQEEIFYALPQEFREKYILNLFPLARKEQDSTPLFPQHNFHWVKRSYYTNIAASEIAKQCNIPFSEPLDIVMYKSEYIKSDISHLTNITLKNTKFLRYPQKKFDKLGIKKISATHYKNPNRTGKIVVIGDSFAKRLSIDLARYFGEVRTYGNNKVNQSNVNKICKKYKPDYVVFLSHKGFFSICTIIDKYEKLYTNAHRVEKSRKMSKPHRSSFAKPKDKTTK